MKKVIGLILIVLAFVFADAPQGNIYVMDAPAWGVDTVISSAVGFDTIAAVDSTTLLTERKLDPDYEYALVHSAFTGTGSDSTDVDVRADMYMYRNDASVFYRQTVDSLQLSAGEVIIIPLGSSVFGSKMTIKLVGSTSAGTQLIINKVALYKRKIR